jgi:AraC-like DNA-binding protein
MIKLIADYLNAANTKGNSIVKKNGIKMKLFIKNMVCDRCKMVVTSEFEKMGITPIKVALGEIELECELTVPQYDILNNSFNKLGFEVIDNTNARTIDKIKTLIITMVHHSEEEVKINYSKHIEENVGKDYTYLSNLFSDIEGLTIEKFIINQKIEKVKELLVYGELTLSEIAYKMGYKNVAYLSALFKRQTGLTPSHFKEIKENKRKSLDKV